MLWWHTFGDRCPVLYYSVRKRDSTVGVAKDPIFRRIFWMVAAVRVGNF